jgi:hypothetical protein
MNIRVEAHCWLSRSKEARPNLQKACSYIPNMVIYRYGLNLQIIYLLKTYEIMGRTKGRYKV